MKIFKKSYYLFSKIKSTVLFLSFFFVFSPITHAQFVQIKVKPDTSSIQTSDLKNIVENVPTKLSVLDLQNAVARGEDISKYSPVDNQLWKNSGFKKPNNFSVVENITAPFLNIAPSGELEFTLTVNINGENRRINFQRKYRNLLLRAYLLEELGYRVPEVHFLPTVKIQFNSATEKDTVIKMIMRKLAAHESWIVAQDETSLTLREGLLIESFSDYLDLTQGVLAESHIQNARALEALSIVYGLTDLNENLKKEAWTAALISDGVVYLSNENGKAYKTNVYDAKWILTKISDLSRKSDFFSKMFKVTQFPSSITPLVEQIFKSRINSIIEAFSFELPEHEVQTNINVSDLIKDGNLDQTACQKQLLLNTVTRFCSTDALPEFLQSNDIWSIVKSYIVSTVRSNLVGLINDKIPIQVDINANIGKQLDEKVQQEWNDFLRTGDYIPAKTKIKPIIYPTFKIVADSNLIIGNYGGTKNLIQRVDTTGIFTSINRLSGINSFKSPNRFIQDPKLFLSLSVGYQRFLTRIKPIVVIPGQELKTNDEGNDSTLVNIWKSAIIDPNANPDLEIENFKARFRVGESLIFTDSLAGQESVNLNYTFPQGANLLGRLFTDQKIIKRIHIHRLNANQIQIYEDRGAFPLFSNWGAELGLSYQIPWFSVVYNSNNPDASSNVYILDLNTKNNDKITAALYHLFKDLDLTDIKKYSKEFSIQHALKQKYLEFNLLHHRWTKMKTSDSIEIKTANGLSKKMFYKTYLNRKSSNIFKLGFDIVKSWLTMKNNQIDLNIPENFTSDQGPLANSSTKSITYEHDFDSNGDIVEQSVVIKQKMKQRKIKQSDLISTVNDLNQKYNASIFEPGRMATIEHILFFELTTTLRMKKSGIDKILSMEPSMLIEYVKNHQQKFTCFETAEGTCAEMKKSAFAYIESELARSFKKYSKKMKANEMNSLADPLINIISILDEYLNVRDFIELAGGMSSFKIDSYISGFRHGDPTALINPVLYSVSLGTTDVYANGPISYYSETLDAISSYFSFVSSEFLALWLIRE